jgi:hypothetical protein
MYYYSRKNILIRSKIEKKLMYLPNIDRIPNYLVVNYSKNVLVTLAYALLITY